MARTSLQHTKLDLRPRSGSRLRNERNKRRRFFRLKRKGDRRNSQTKVNSGILSSERIGVPFTMENGLNYLSRTLDKTKVILL